MTDTYMMEAAAHQRIANFARTHGKAALLLAYHAALPTALNADLLHFLRINFLMEERFAPTIEADLLLSSLCEEIDDGLYEMEPGMRNVLLQKLTSKYGRKRLREVALLLWQYNEKYMPWAERVELERAQQLTALNFLAPERASEWLAAATNQTAAGKHAWLVAMHNELEQVERPHSKITQQKEDTVAIPDLGLKLIQTILSEEQRQRAGLETATGFIIFLIKQHGPAKETQLRVGDIMTELNGRELKTVQDISNAISSREEDAGVFLYVLRAEYLLEVKVHIPRQGSES